MTYRLLCRQLPSAGRCEDGLSADACERLVRVLARFDGLAYLVVHSMPDHGEVWRWQPEHGPFDVKGLELALSAHERAHRDDETARFSTAHRPSPLTPTRFISAARAAVRMPVPARLPAEDELLVDEHRRDQERPDA